MTETEWLSCTDPKPMLNWLRSSGKASDRKLRLFAVACCRRVWPLLQCGKGHEAVGVAERYADGEANLRSLDAAQAEMEREAREWERWVPYESDDLGEAEATWAAWAMTRPTRTPAFLSVVDHAANAATGGGRRWERLPAGWHPSEALLLNIREKLAVEARTQCNLLRDIFGNPFRATPAIEPAWLTWNDGTTTRLASAIYDERAFDLMPALSDALEEAGCDNQDILSHCRSSGPHVRGCWVVDALLGRS